MRKYIISALAGLLLASCTPTLAEIQAATIKLCGFVPDAVAVASFFPNPYVVPAVTIAQAICVAVQSQVPLSVKRNALRSRTQVSVKVSAGGEAFVVTGHFIPPIQ